METVVNKTHKAIVQDVEEAKVPSAMNIKPVSIQDVGRHKSGHVNVMPEHPVDAFEYELAKDYAAANFIRAT